MQDGLFFWPLIALSAAAALAYGLYFERRPPSLLRALVKTVFMGALAAAFFGGHPLFFVALVAAAFGDFFLAFDKPWALPLGMAAFLVMQVLYCAIFFFMWIFAGDSAPILPRYIMMIATILVIATYVIWFWREKRAGNPALAFAAIVAAFAIGATPLVLAGASYLITIDPENIAPTMNWWAVAAFYAACIAVIWLRRDLGLVKLGGMIYAALIAQMTLLSFWLPWAAWPAMLGAALFLISDGVLSAELFRMQPDAPARRITGPVVWWTYAAAQALIVFGVTRVAM